LQEFDLEIKDKNGIENVVADHLSRIPNAPTETIPINGNFLDEHIFTMCKEPWYADIANYWANTFKFVRSGQASLYDTNMIFLLG